MRRIRRLAWPLFTRRVPMIAQQEAVECGAACLTMLLAYYGRWLTLEELREQCGITRDGTKATNILKAARLHGMVAKGLQKEPDQLTALPLPLIVFWNFNHFVVVERIDDKHVHLVDPASGPVKLTRAEFAEAYTGIALAFEPGPDFVATGGRRSLYATLSGYLDGYRPGLGFAVLAGMGLIIPGMLASGFNQFYVENILIEGRHTWITPLVTGMIFTALLKVLLTWLTETAMVRLDVSMAAGLSAKQMWRLLKLPLSFFAQRYSADVARRFALITQLTGLVSHTLAPALIGVPNLIVYLALLLLLDPVLASVTVVAALLAVLVLVLAIRSMENASRRLVLFDSKIYTMTVQGFSQAEEIKMSGTESSMTTRWSGAQARVISVTQTSGMQANLLHEASWLIIGLASVGVLVVGGMRVMDGVLSIGALLAFQTLMGSFVTPLLGIVGVGGQLQAVRGLVDRLDDIERYGVPLPGAAAATAPVLPSRSPRAPLPFLALHGIGFGYSPLSPPIVKDVSFEVPVGSRVALVGSSGSGKSTLGRIIAGLSVQTSGALEIAGRLRGDWEGTTAPVQAYVEQTVAMFEGSVHENLTLWDSTIPAQRVNDAARDAQAHDFIMRLNNGYDAHLTEGGRNLSGGERQRLAIARALAVEPALLVLDEATSALDPATEVAIMDAVRRRGCTCVIIAQRLSSIRDCDCIVVMRQGEIVEMGTHLELMALQGEYHTLVSA